MHFYSLLLLLLFFISSESSSSSSSSPNTGCPPCEDSNGPPFPCPPCTYVEGTTPELGLPCDGSLRCPDGRDCCVPAEPKSCCPDNTDPAGPCPICDDDNIPIVPGSSPIVPGDNEPDCIFGGEIILILLPCSEHGNGVCCCNLPCTHITCPVCDDDESSNQICDSQEACDNLEECFQN